jgi:hypothetical protein
MQDDGVLLISCPNSESLIFKTKAVNLRSGGWRSQQDLVRINQPQPAQVDANSGLQQFLWWKRRGRAGGVSGI